MDNVCYATSVDGINWTKPDLGIIKGTNIILPYVHKNAHEIIPFLDDVSYLRPDLTTVFIDYDASKAEKYKLFLRNPGWEYPGIIGVSEDGIHFSKLAYTGIVGDRTTMFYNPFRKNGCIVSEVNFGTASLKEAEYIMNVTILRMQQNGTNKMNITG